MKGSPVQVRASASPLQSHLHGPFDHTPSRQIGVNGSEMAAKPRLTPLLIPPKGVFLGAALRCTAVSIDAELTTWLAASNPGSFSSQGSFLGFGGCRPRPPDKRETAGRFVEQLPPDPPNPAYSADLDN
jgi:hypothetical protein